MNDALDEIESLAVRGEWRRILLRLNSLPDIGTAIFSQNRTALTALSGFGNVELVQRLLDMGGDPNWKDDSGETPLLASLDTSSGRDTLAVTRLLLEKGGDPNEFAYLGQTALHLAAERGLANHLKLLLEHGGNPYLKTNDLDREDAFEIAKRRARFSSEVSVVLSKWREARK